jgi:hypothetical protein
MTRQEFDVATRRLLVEAWDTTPLPRTLRGVVTRYRRLVNVDETLTEPARAALLNVFPSVLHAWGLEKIDVEVAKLKRFRRPEAAH